MKKILFLGLFLQANLVLGQIRQSTNFESEKQRTDKAEKVVTKLGKDKTIDIYDINGYFLSQKIYHKKKLTYKVAAKYDEKYNLSYKKMTKINIQKNADTTIREKYYFRYTSDSMLLLTTFTNCNNEKYIDALTFEVIDQKLRHKSIYFFDYEYCKDIGVKLNDTSLVKKVTTLQGALSHFKKNSFEEKVYDEKNRPIVINYGELKYIKIEEKDFIRHDTGLMQVQNWEQIHYGSHHYEYTSERSGSCNSWVVNVNGPPTDSYDFELYEYDKIGVTKHHGAECSAIPLYKSKLHQLFYKLKPKPKIRQKIQYYD